LWWKKQFTPGVSSVAGLTIHPNTDLIVTGSSGLGAVADSVAALYNDGPYGTGVGKPVHWSFGSAYYGSSTNLGGVSAAPAVGAGDAVAARTYIATQAGDIVALNADGSVVWGCGTSTTPHPLDPLKTTPAIAPVSKLGGETSCEGVFAGSSNSSFWGACRVGTTNGCDRRSVSITGAVNDSPVSVAPTGMFFVGTDTRVNQVTLDTSNGSFFGTVPLFPGSNVVNVTGVAVGKSGQLLAGAWSGKVASPDNFYAFSSDLSPNWSTNFSAQVSGTPVIEADGSALLSTNDSKLHLLAFGTSSSGGKDSGPWSVAGNTGTPLLSSDGKAYLTSTGNGHAVLAVDDSGSRSTDWSFPLPVDSTVAPTMDCNGHLFVAAGDTVYALITEAQGLRDTPWPKYQRDSRNSGNAQAFTPKWGVRTAPGVAGCTQ
jgi:hypothetical protein